MKPRVLVVDDDERIAASVRRALDYAGYDVSVAHNGPAAVAAAGSGDPDLIVLDVMMPGYDGLEVARRLRRAGNNTPILMLTARTSVPDRVDGLEAGADDYLIKPFAHDELLARVRALLRRHLSQEREILSFADLEIDVASMEVRRGTRNVDLTTLEFNFLEYFARNPRVVLSRSRIREAVWDLDGDTTSNIVDVYVRYLRQKLEEGGEPRLLQTVRGVGYILKETI
ncbi:MAG: response regulator transcription factor [Acidimicrobiia bacterium]